MKTYKQIEHCENYNPIHKTPLAGARIWLSGAFTTDEYATSRQHDNALQFVRQFARQVFALGGSIIHGGHPGLTTALLEEAAKYQAKGGRKDVLTLVVSEFWLKGFNNNKMKHWRKSAIVYEIPEGSEYVETLEISRNWMVSRCDAVVVIGEKWRENAAGYSALPLELSLAVERGLPCFLLGYSSKAAKNHIINNPSILRYLKNGLSESENQKFAVKSNIASLTTKLVHQLTLLPLVRGDGNTGSSFRILALDGGGTKGAFTASVLATWEKQTKLKVVDHFDLIAGTSTGGLLAIGLGLGLTAEQLLDFYKDRSHIVFPNIQLRDKLIHTANHVWKPKYSQEVLLKELQRAYYLDNKQRSIGDSKCRLMITAYDAVAGTSHVFRTPHHPDLTSDKDIPAAEIALATAAAPTYFSAAKIDNTIGESSYFDGSIWAYSPTMAAIIEATCFLKIPLERIEVLSVGTTEEAFSVSEQTSAGALGWLWNKRIIDLLMSAQQESSLRLSQCLVGEPKFLRVNHVTQPGSFSLDSPNQINDLKALGISEASKPEIIRQIKSRFLNGIKVSPWERFG